VPIGGAYRLIDVPMSNCINSGINRIYILTQFNSTSLNRHLQRAYNFAPGISTSQGQFVEVLAANQTPDDMSWFQGTADAVRQYSWLLEDIKNRKVRRAPAEPAAPPPALLPLPPRHAEHTRTEQGARSGV
jgi:glucose-1-phosphate adenylyltransferase